MSTTTVEQPVEIASTTDIQAVRVVSRGDLAWVAWITALCVALGAILALAVRTTARIQNSGAPVYRFGVAGGIISTVRQENERLESEVTELNRQVREYEANADDQSKQQAEFKRQFEELKYWAGLQGVRGPGLKITLQDSPISRAGIPESDWASMVIHDVDLNGLVSELKAANAEAIAIGGADGRKFQRWVHKTTARCTGPTAVVNGVYLSAPFTILAIGSPENLRASLEMPGGFIKERYLDELKMVKIEEVKELHLPGYAGSTHFDFARPETDQP